jgi:hypothetical protein
MTSLQKQARTAGFLYLLLVFAPPVRLMYVPGKLFVDGNSAATAANIAAHQGLFRFGMATDLASAAVLVFVALALFDLFADVDRRLARMMVVLGGVLPSAIYMINLLNDAGALLFATGAGPAAAFAQAHRESMTGVFLHLHHQVTVCAELFWGLWLLPLAALIFRSRTLPRFLAVWLVLNGIAYIALSATGLLWPTWEDRLSGYAFPALLGEVAFMLWLLIAGAKDSKPARPAEAP